MKVKKIVVDFCNWYRELPYFSFDLISIEFYLTIPFVRIFSNKWSFKLFIIYLFITYYVCIYLCICVASNKNTRLWKRLLKPWKKFFFLILAIRMAIKFEPNMCYVFIISNNNLSKYCKGIVKSFAFIYQFRILVISTYNSY